MNRGAVLVASTLVATIGLATPVAGAVLWSIVGTPLTATVFQTTTYTFTATNLADLNGLGCIEIQLPDSYVIDGLGKPSASNGDDWDATIYGGTNWVLVHSNSGGGRLEVTEWVTFTVQATATQVGAQTWNTHGHRQHDCSGPEVEPGVWSSVVAPVVLPAPTAPPPTPRPQPVDTPAPSATASPTETPRPPPSSTPRPTPNVIPAPADPPTTRSPVGRMALLSDGQGGSSYGLGTEVFALLDGPLVWFVPGATVGVPGLLILLWIALQAAGTMAWIPAVRRMSGDPVPARRRRRPGS